MEHSGKHSRQAEQFNPFEDRLSRDLRNDLSEAFVRDLETQEQRALPAILNHYQSMALPAQHAEYLEKRRRAYSEALTRIRNNQQEFPPAADLARLPKAVVLWNLGLFFEVHEILEHAWYSAKNEYKEILQAMIRSAGVYVKLEYGYSEAAKRIGAKALPVLERHREILADYFQPGPLLKNLHNPRLPAPCLEAP